MADKPDESDHIDTSTKTPDQATSAVRPKAVESLPQNEPTGTAGEQQAELEAQVASLQGTLEYMGDNHPQKPGLKQQLANLETMLRKLKESQAAIAQAKSKKEP